MKSSAKDQAEGTLHEVKGKLKEMAGKISGNPKLEALGRYEKISAQIIAELECKAGQEVTLGI